MLHYVKELLEREAQRSMCLAYGVLAKNCKRLSEIDD